MTFTNDQWQEAIVQLANNAGGVGDAVSIADGSNVTQGNKSDSAITDVTQSASEIALLKGAVTLLTNPANPTYEYNAGGPVLANGTPSGLNTDRRKNAQGKGVGTGTVTTTVANDSALVFSSAPLTLPASAIITLSGGVNPQEDVYASASFAPGAGVVTVALQNNVVYAGHTTATWSVYAPNGPLANHFTADGVGLTVQGFYDPTDTSGTPYVQGQVDANKNVKVVDANSASMKTDLDAINTATAASKTDLDAINTATAASKTDLDSILTALQGTLKAAVTKTLSAVLYTTTQTGVTSWAGTGDISGLGNYTELFIHYNFTAFSGTSVAFKVQRKDSFGNWHTIDSGFTASATGATPRSLGSGMNVNQGFTNDVQIIATFTSATVTFTVDIYGK